MAVAGFGRRRRACSDFTRGCRCYWEEVYINCLGPIHHRSFEQHFELYHFACPGPFIHNHRSHCITSLVYIFTELHQLPQNHQEISTNSTIPTHPHIPTMASKIPTTPSPNHTLHPQPSSHNPQHTYTPRPPRHPPPSRHSCTACTARARKRGTRSRQASARKTKPPSSTTDRPSRASGSPICTSKPTSRRRSSPCTTTWRTRSALRRTGRRCMARRSGL